VSNFLMKTGFYITRIHGIMIVQRECTEFLSSITRVTCQVKQEVAVHFDQKLNSVAIPDNSGLQEL